MKHKILIVHIKYLNYKQESSMNAICLTNIFQIRLKKRTQSFEDEEEDEDEDEDGNSEKTSEAETHEEEEEDEEIVTISLYEVDRLIAILSACRYNAESLKIVNSNSFTLGKRHNLHSNNLFNYTSRNKSLYKTYTMNNTDHQNEIKFEYIEMNFY